MARLRKRARAPCRARKRPATGPYGRRAGGGYIPDYIVLTMRRPATEP